MIMKRSLLISLFLLPLLLWGQVSFVAKAPSQVQVGQQFQVSFSLTNAEGSDFSAPSFAEFEVWGGPMAGQSYSYRSVNGKTSSVTTYTYDYVLSAKKTGRLRIPSASIKANGRVMRTAPLNISVSQSVPTSSSTVASHSSAPTPTPTSRRKVGEKDLFFSAELSSHQVYEQEPVMLTYKFHALPGVGLVNVALRQKPDLKGFWTQEIELPRNLAPQVETRAGHQYRVGKNLEFLLFPQQTGKLAIPAINFDCEVMQNQGDFDEIEAFFRGAGSLSTHLRRTTQPLTLEVLPLPTPRPTNFSGAVGHLTAKGQILGATPKTNDIATYRLTLKGTGNLKLIKAPNIKFPKEFDTYSPKLHEDIRTSHEGLTGEIHFDYNFVPREVGTFTIPSVEFSYFDTQKKAYTTLRTQALTLSIEKGERSMADVDAELALQRSDIRDIRVGDALLFSDKSFLWLGSWAYLLLLVLFIAMAILLLKFAPRLYAEISDAETKRSRKASARAHQRMRHVEKMLHTANTPSFFNAMAEALLGYFADKLHEERTALTHQRIIQRLQENGVQETDIAETRNILEEIDFGRFAPLAENASKEELFRRTNALLQRLETQIR